MQQSPKKKVCYNAGCEVRIINILITGSTGLLAKGLEETASEGTRLFGVHLRPYHVHSARANHSLLDIRDRNAVLKYFDGRAIDVVIHAAGMAAVDQVEKHPEEGRTSNVEGTINIAEACRRSGAHLIYISTNAVFDGTEAPYSEECAPRPVNTYGRLKLECEAAARERLPGCAVARPILMFGWNHQVNRPNPATWIYDKLLRGEAVSLVDDVFENPLYNIHCARALWAIAAKRASGLFHLAGGDRVNRLEFGRRVAETFGLDATLIKPAKSSDFPGIAARPPDTTMATRRMQEVLGIFPMGLSEALLDMKERMEARV